MSSKDSNNIETSVNPNDSKQKKKSKFKKFLTYFTIFIVIMGLVGSSIVAGLVFSVVKNIPPVDFNNIYSLMDESSFIYDKDGNLIEKLHSGNFRSIVSIDQIPLDLQNAFIAIEDERFYEHNGVDIKRIFGALAHDIKTMSAAQGASTITLQVAKNLYTSSEKTITRKIKDAYYAIQMEKVLDKKKILEVYMNTAYLGRGAIGVQAAAQTYFSKDVEELTIPEAAIIAGITKFPSRYSVYTTEKISPQDDIQHLQLIFYPRTEKISVATPEEKAVFKKMLDANIIDKFQYDELMKDSIVARKAVLNPKSKERQETVLYKMHELKYITDQEYEEAKAAPIEIKLSNKAAQGISSYFADLVKDQVEKELLKRGYTDQEASDAIYKGGLRIYSTLDLKLQKIVEDEYGKESNFPGTFVDDNGHIQPQSSMVIIQQDTGMVRALVGGRMIGGKRLYNRALNPRQPGSAIKPIAVYLPAMEKGISPGTVLDDVPMYNNGKLWPNNWDRTYKGLTTVRQLLQNSSNSGTVRLAQMLGNSKYDSVKSMMNSLERLGISTLVHSSENKRVNDENFSLALGGMSDGVTPLEITAAYATLANNGTYIEPVVFTRVETSNGEVLFESQPIRKDVVSPQDAFLVGDMMRTVVTEGLAKRAQISNMDVAGKTGTTSAKKDAWFVGYTPYYTAGVWIGVDSPKPLKKGSAMSAQLWKNVMAKIHSDLPGKRFKQPSGLERATICTESGKLVTDLCPTDPRGTVRTELFKKGQSPKDYCDVHISIAVNSENNKRATNLTPADKIIYKTFIQRKTPYEGSPAPLDIQYQVPTELDVPEVIETPEGKTLLNPDGTPAQPSTETQAGASEESPSTTPDENPEIVDPDEAPVDPWLLEQESQQ